MTLQLYTDGSSGHDRSGGWACIAVMDGKELWRMSGRDTDTTNNRMELTAILRGLARLAKHTGNVTVITDSQYAIQVVTASDWQANAYRINADLIQQCRSLLRGKRNRRHNRRPRATTEFVWVKGHNGNEWNEAADKLAGRARTPRNRLPIHGGTLP